MRPPLHWPTPGRPLTLPDPHPMTPHPVPPSAHRPAPSTPPQTRERAVTALHEGLAIVPDKIISAHDSARQFLGLTPRTTGQWLTQIGL